MISTLIFKSENRSGDAIIVEGSEARHAVDILRLKAGEMVRLIDGSGEAHICEIAEIGKKSFVARVVRTNLKSGEASLEITLAAGLSQASKFDTIIEKGTEVGVCSFIPLFTDKGRIRIDRAREKNKLSRWQRIARAAAKQAGRSLIPEISPPRHFPEFLGETAAERTIIFHPDGGASDIVRFANNYRDNRITIMVGPEAGFSAGEIESARQKGIPVLSLGERVLRTETAGAVIPALIIYTYEMVKG